MTSLGNHLRSTYKLSAGHLIMVSPQYFFVRVVVQQLLFLNSNCNQNCPFLLFVYSFLILLCMHSAHYLKGKCIIPQYGNMLSLVNDSLSTSGALGVSGRQKSHLTLKSGMGHPHFMIQSVPDIFFPSWLSWICNSTLQK